MKCVRRIARVLAWLVLPALLVACLLAGVLPGVLLGAATLTSFNVTSNVSWNYQTSRTGVSNPTTDTNGFSFSVQTTNGTGAAGTADLIFYTQAVIAASGNTTIDLVGGSNDVFGTAISMARLKFLYVHNTSLTNASSVTVGNAAAPVNLFSAGTATVSVRNNGVFLYGDSGATGVPMTNAVSDGLKIVNADGANSATVNVVAVGSSA